MAEPLGVLLLPAKLEAFELEGHARALLAIPRVIALEPSRHRTPTFLREAAPARQAKRLRFPGEPRLLVLYHPRQYPLARALDVKYEDAELWYLRPALEAVAADPDFERDELADLDRLATERATESRVLAYQTEPRELEQTLRARMLELDIISSRPFVPGARIHGLPGRAP